VIKSCVLCANDVLLIVYVDIDICAIDYCRYLFRYLDFGMQKNMQFVLC